MAANVFAASLPELAFLAIADFYRPAMQATAKLFCHVTITVAFDTAFKTHPSCPFLNCLPQFTRKMPIAFHANEQLAKGLVDLSPMATSVPKNTGNSRFCISGRFGTE